MASRRFDSAIRSGRFKGDASGGGITIVEARTGGLYRILNSGDSDFNVFLDTTDLGALTPGTSLDVSGDDGIIIKGGAAVAGIFEHLDLSGSQASTRSGRFAFTAATTVRQLIIELTRGGPTRNVYYRIFNSGSKSIGVRDVIDSANPRFTIAAGQSRDFAIDEKGGGNAKRKIWVSTTTNNDSISGIYELLGAGS